MPGCPGHDLIQQELGLGSISPLTGCQNQMQKLTTTAYGAVQFGRQSSSTASEAPPGVGVFFFPAGCRRPVEETGCAFTLLESR